MPRTRDCRPARPAPRHAVGAIPTAGRPPPSGDVPTASADGPRRPLPPEDRPRLARARRRGRFLVPPAATIPASTGPHVLPRIRVALPRHRRAARRGPRPWAPLRLRTPWRRSPGRADGPDPVLRTTSPTVGTASGCGAPPTARRPGRGSTPPRAGCTGSPRNSPSRRPRRRPRRSSRRRFAPLRSATMRPGGTNRQEPERETGVPGSWPLRPPQSPTAVPQFRAWHR